jgi:molybdopterin-guanine dinucleotide biosynthesis protein MobB
MKPAVLSVCAPSGTGKTTLLVEAIRLLCGEGWKVGAMKHCHHGAGEDGPGKDSWRLAEAGATPCIAVEDQETVDSLLSAQFKECDIVLLEGFRRLPYPSIVLRRGEPEDGWVMPINTLGILQVEKHGEETAAQELRGKALQLMDGKER